MKSLLKKARENKKGFTLAELLVVVAIVGILVAISIPVFTAQLDKAREATNQANLRAAKAAAVAEYLTSEDTNRGTALYYEYDVAAGSIKSGSPKTDKPGNTYTEFSTMDDAKISGKVVYDDIWVGITTSADDEKGTISNESVKMYAKSTKSSTTESK